ncbi:hypothetical protein MRX96_033299 [Rhipicephalus microplus]
MNDKASLMHQTTEGEKPTGHLEKGMTDDRHGPPKSSLGKAENFAGPEKIPKKSVLKMTKGQVCEGGKAIDYLAEGRDLASEGVLQSCLKNSKMAAALRQGAEPAKDDEEEEEAKAAWRAMMRRKDSIAVHRVTQKKHERQGLVAEEEPQVLQLGKHRPSPVHKTETRPVAEGEPVVVQLAKQGLSPDQKIEHWPEKANKPAALLPQCAAFARGGDEEEEASRWEMMRKKDSIAVHRTAQKHKGREPVAEGEPAVLLLGRRGHSPAAQMTKIQRPMDAAPAHKAGILADTGLSPPSSGQSRQKGRHRGRNRVARGATPKEQTRSDSILRIPEGRLDAALPRAIPVSQGGPLSPTLQSRNLSPMMHSPDMSSPQAVAVLRGENLFPTARFETLSPVMHSPYMSSPRENLSPDMHSPVMTAGSTVPRHLGPGGVHGGMPMGPMPPVGMIDMRGRMPRRRMRWRGRQRKGPYAVGDSASKEIEPDKVKFSRIKMSPQNATGGSTSSAALSDFRCWISYKLTQRRKSSL